MNDMKITAPKHLIPFPSLDLIKKNVPANKKQEYKLINIQLFMSNPNHTKGSNSSSYTMHAKCHIPI